MTTIIEITKSKKATNFFNQLVKAKNERREETIKRLKNKGFGGF